MTQAISPTICMTPPLINLVTSFDWSRPTGHRLPPYVPFQIKVQDYNVVLHSTIIDESTPISILSSTT